MGHFTHLMSLALDKSKTHQVSQIDPVFSPRCIPEYLQPGIVKIVKEYRESWCDVTRYILVDIARLLLPRRFSDCTFYFP